MIIYNNKSYETAIYILKKKIVRKVHIERSSGRLGIDNKKIVPTSQTTKQFKYIKKINMILSS